MHAEIILSAEYSSINLCVAYLLIGLPLLANLIFFNINLHLKLKPLAKIA